MNTYKSIEIYESAFSLAVKAYRINIILPVNDLIKFGNKLRRLTVQVKDFIAEGYTTGKNDQELSEYLLKARISCDETVLLLNKLNKQNHKNKLLDQLTMDYIKLKNSISKKIKSLTISQAVLTIPYPENEVVGAEFKKPDHVF
jgi:four helix bundle protein